LPEFKGSDEVQASQEGSDNCEYLRSSFVRYRKEGNFAGPRIRRAYFKVRPAVGEPIKVL
jgi:hypothetical protein